MRTLFALPLLFASLAAAQTTAAPPVPQTQNHVPAERAQQAASQASAAAETQKKGTQLPADNDTVVLDSVVAIINGDVILQSDVDQERRFESLQMLPAGENTEARAAEHLITRTLILQQMKLESQATPTITDAQLNKFLAELRQQIPGCAPHRCDSEAGWAAFLSRLELTPQEVRDRWKQRLVILDYFNLRFKTGLRIPTEQALAYYNETFVPQFKAKHLPPPSFKAVEPRIDNLLMQQQVSKQIDDWEGLLRNEGSIEILVPEYGQSNAKGQDEDLIGDGV